MTFSIHDSKMTASFRGASCTCKRANGAAIAQICITSALHVNVLY